MTKTENSHLKQKEKVDIVCAIVVALLAELCFM